MRADVIGLWLVTGWSQSLFLVSASVYSLVLVLPCWAARAGTVDLIQAEITK